MSGPHVIRCYVEYVVEHNGGFLGEYERQARALEELKATIVKRTLGARIVAFGARDEGKP